MFILSEQALCQSKATLAAARPVAASTVDRGKTRSQRPVVFGEYRRFAFTEDGVSPRAIPGIEGGMHLAAGLRAQRHGVITENATQPRAR